MAVFRRRRRPTSYPESALADADVLVRRHRRTEAIELLSNANRERRDPSIERRLVELRHEAFRLGTWRDPGKGSSSPVDDLFPGELVPEIPRERLTVEVLRSAIERHGSVLVRGLVPAEGVERLVADIDNAFAAFDADASGEQRPDLAGWYTRFEPDRLSDRTRRRSRGNLTAAESPPALFDLFEILQQAGIGNLAEEYFGEPPMLLARKTTLRRIPHNGTGGWHQDGVFMGATIRSLNVWLALSHCGDVAPGLDIVGRRFEDLVQMGDPDSPKMGSGYAEWGVSPENAAKAANGAVVRPIFEPGDALLFDHLMLHRTGTEPSMTEDRYAIETWLFAPSTYGVMTAPAKDGYSPRDQFPIYF